MQNLLNKLNVERDIALKTQAEDDETTLMYVMANNDPELRAVLSHQAATGLVDAFNVVEKWLKQPLTVYVVMAENFNPDLPTGRIIIAIFANKADADAMCDSINSGEHQRMFHEGYQDAIVEEHHLTFPTI